jgi:hypothetical protein
MQDKFASISRPPLIHSIGSNVPPENNICLECLPSFVNLDLSQRLAGIDQFASLGWDANF